ncbi:MAG: DUF2190 family protein [Clostridia bacterium]|nr:DUF2190 family protein [Clostridia bacterium]
MTANISLNQFAPNAQIAGLYAYMPNRPQPHNLIVSASQATPLKSGAIVTLDTSSTNKFAPVIKQAAVDDPIYGVIAYNPVDHGMEYSAGKRCSVAKDGDVVWLPAAAAIAVGASLYFNSSNKVTSTVSAGNSIVGIALTPATAADELIQVELHFATTAA